MDKRELTRVLDQVKPSPAQKEAMLARLLASERKGNPVKKLKKLTVVGIAAALMVIACAAAMVAGIDQRLMDLLNAQPAQEELISPYAVPVNIRVNDNGGTLQVRQVLMDRYTIMVLVDFTVPDGIELDNVRRFRLRPQDHSYFLDSNGTEVSPGANGADWSCIEKDTAERRVTLLYSLDLAVTSTAEADSLLLLVHDLQDVSGQTLLSGDWSCVIPIPSDSGLEAAMDEVYWTAETEERVTEVYLSPMTFHITMERDVPLDGGMDWSIWQEEYSAKHAEWLLNNILLTDKNGETVALKTKNCVGNPQKTTLTFGFEELVDPACFQGGTLSIMGQTISLDGLSPAA